MNCYLYPGYRGFIGREELKKLMSSTYQTWCKVCEFHHVPPDDWSLNGQYSYIQFTNGSRIDLLDLKYLPGDPLFERFGSLEYSSGFIDEAGEIEYKAFDILKSRIGRQDLGVRPTIAMTCNPKKGWLYNIFYLPWKNGTLEPGYAFVQSLYQDNTYLPPNAEGSLLSISDKSTKARLVFGDWDYEDPENCMIPFEVISDMFSNDFIVGGKKYIVADVARYGVDKAVIVVWSGLRLIDLVTFDKSSTTDIQNCINALRSKYQVPVSQIIVDEDGVGGGVVDTLKCRGFVNGSSPTNPAYMNLKCECGYKLAELASKIYIACELSEKVKETIKTELSMLRTYDGDSEGKLRLLPKSEIKQLIGRSPDYLDTFIMRMFWETFPARKGMTASELSEYL